MKKTILIILVFLFLSSFVYAEQRLVVIEDQLLTEGKLGGTSIEKLQIIIDQVTDKQYLVYLKGRVGVAIIELKTTEVICGENK